MGFKPAGRKIKRFLSKNVVNFLIPLFLFSSECTFSKKDYLVKDCLKNTVNKTALKQICREEIPVIDSYQFVVANPGDLSVNQRIDTCSLEGLGVLTKAEGPQLECLFESKDDSGLSRKVYQLSGEINNWDGGSGSFPLIYFGETKKGELVYEPNEGEGKIYYETTRINPKARFYPKVFYQDQRFAGDKGWLWRHGAGLDLRFKPFPISLKNLEFEVASNFYDLYGKRHFYEVEGKVNFFFYGVLREIPFGIKTIFSHSNYQPEGNLAIGFEVFGDELGQGNLSSFARTFDDFEYSTGIKSFINSKTINYQARLEFLLDYIRHVGAVIKINGYRSFGSYSLNENFIKMKFPRKEGYFGEITTLPFEIIFGPKIRIDLDSFRFDFRYLMFIYTNIFFGENNLVNSQLPTGGFIFEIGCEY